MRETAQQQTAQQREPLPARIYQRLLQPVWDVHPSVLLVFNAPPEICLRTLVIAAKPSTKRLHLRDLFAGGRRYDLRLADNRFSMTTTTRVRWHYRRRTGGVARVSGVLHGAGGANGGTNDSAKSSSDHFLTHIRLRSRIRVLYLLDIFLIPTFMASIIVFMDWPHALIAALVLALYLLSWVGHYYNARLEANEMIFFVQKALEEYAPPETQELAAGAIDVPYSRDFAQDFAQAWQRFYDQQAAQIDPDDNTDDDAPD